MRFISFSVEEFGKLKEWQSPPLDRRPVVVYGPNEAGKSTLFHLLSTLLYGFYPANREQFPYTPWDAGVPSGQGEICLKDGSRVKVYRRLRSQPEGQLIRDEVREELRNRTVPFAGHIPRLLFQDLYALSLDKLCFPKARLWAELQDFLAGGSAVTFMRPLSEVARELEKEADSLWRTDRRGNPRDRQLGRELRDWQKKRRSAREREDKIRSLVKKREQLQQELSDLEESHLQLKTFLYRSKRLAPIKRKMDRIKELYEFGGDLHQYEEVPADPLNYDLSLAEEIQKLEEKLESLQREMKAKANICKAFAHKDGPLEAYMQQAKQLLREAGPWSAAEDRYKLLEGKIQELEKSLFLSAKEVFTQQWVTEWETPVSEISLRELRLRLSHWREAHQSWERAKSHVAAQRAQGISKGKAVISPLSIALLGVGLAILLVGKLRSIRSVQGLGGGILVLAGAEVWAWYRRRQEWSRWREELSWAMDKAAEEERIQRNKWQEARQKVKGVFAALPLASVWLEHPTEDLIGEIKDLQTLLGDLDRFRGEKAVLKKELAKNLEELSCLARKCQLGGEFTRSIPELLVRLEIKVTDFFQEKEAAEIAAHRLAELEDEKAQLVGDLTRLQEEREKLQGILRELGTGHWEEGARLLGRRRQALAEATILEKDLSREEPDLDSLAAEITAAMAAGEDWLFTDQEIVRVENEVAELWEEIAAKQKEIVALDKDLELYSGEITLDYIEGKIQALEDERRQIWVKRDRLMLLRNLLLEAERRFREKHQPDVLRRGGEYLKEITGGHYQGLFLTEEEGNKHLYLQQQDRTYPVQVTEATSRGTLDQVYFSLRLALIDHLDAHQTRLPLYLDEVLVNWDKERREGGLAVIAAISKIRQVFIFTCHRWLLVEMREKLGAQVIDLTQSSKVEEKIN
jgi:uncharacterized protein YhaN